MDEWKNNWPKPRKLRKHQNIKINEWYKSDTAELYEENKALKRWEKRKRGMNRRNLKGVESTEDSDIKIDERNMCKSYSKRQTKKDPPLKQTK